MEFFQNALGAKEEKSRRRFASIAIRRSNVEFDSRKFSYVRRIRKYNVFRAPSISTRNGARILNHLSSEF